MKKNVTRPMSPRRPGPLVETGDYLVSLTIGGETMRQVLRVERLAGESNEPFGGESGGF